MSYTGYGHPAGLCLWAPGRVVALLGAFSIYCPGRLMKSIVAFNLCVNRDFGLLANLHSPEQT